VTTLHIHCLGAFQATLDGNPLAFDTDKSRALLAYLAIEAGQPQHRARLAGLLWSDAPEERALHNLRQALSGLRKSLGDDANAAPYLLIQRDTVQFNPQSDAWLDVTALETDLSAAQQHYQPGPGPRPHCRLNLRQLQRAVARFRGPLLDQLYLSGSPLFDEWASLKREALNQRMIAALALLADQYERRGEMAQARQFASQIAALAPWDETAQAQVMRLLAVEGQWSAAQAQYHHLRRYLREQLAVEPTAETAALFEQIRSHAAQNRPLAAKQPRARHNLPLAAIPLIGREDELDAIAAALADPCCRLLTILGPGGVGKSHLALEAARGQVGIFADGVFCAPLAALTNADMLPAALADALGFTFFGEEPASEQLVRYLAEKHVLLLLDNLEQLLPLAAEGLIVQILAHAPGVALLITSRQRLNLQEECLLPLNGLAYPTQQDIRADQGADPEHASVQLFVSRAQRVQPGFGLHSAANRQAAAQICHLLEGLPLGIELAAASLWSHTAAEIAASLSNSLHSFESAAINASDRHRSLWAAFEVSWALLSAEEQAILAQLAVFRGGFDAALAQQVIRAPVALLAALVDKSLLRRGAAESDTTGRYHLHEAIRQFAAEKLAAAPAQAAATRRDHAQVLASFLAARTAALKSAGQMQALAEIALEWENVRQAWAWLVQHAAAEAISHCAEAIYHFCGIRWRHTEAIELFTAAADALGGAPAVQARVLTFLGAAAYRSFEMERCETALQRALELYTTLDLPNPLALCLVYASGLASRRKDPPLARQRCLQALALFEQTGDTWGQAYAYYQLGLLESRAGRVTEMRQALEASLQAARASGDQRRQIGPLNLLGDLACQMGAYAESQTWFEQALALSRDLDDRYNIALTLINLGTAHHYTAHFDQAKQCYEESIIISQDIGDLSNQGLALSNLCELALVQGRFAEGLAYARQGLALASKARDEWGELIGWINLADAAIHLKDVPAARDSLAHALPRAAQSKEPALLLRALLHQGRLHLLMGEKEKASALLGLVIHHPATYDEHREAARQALQEAHLPIPPAATITLETAVG
jgi:predicted ATPase/DNA-binding SARP family transcriptional activator